MTTYYYGNVTINMPDGQQERVPSQQISITGSGKPTGADLTDESFKDVPLPSFNGYTPQVKFRVEPADNTDPIVTIVKEKSGYVLKFPQLKANLPFYDYIVNYIPQYSNYTRYVYGPDNVGSTGIANFYKKVAQQTINHNMNDNQYLNNWSTANFTSQQLVNALGGYDFVNEKTSYRNQLLPTYAGYHPVITSATASNQYHEGIPGFTRSELVAVSSKLVAKLNACLADHPNKTSLPAYSVDMPLNVAFYIHYVKDAVPTLNPSPSDDHHEETVLPGSASSNNNQRSIDQLASGAKVVNSYSGISTFTPFVVSDSSHAQRQSKQLPQTGDKTNLSVIGLGVVGFLGMLGLAGLSKKQR